MHNVPRIKRILLLKNMIIIIINVDDEILVLGMIELWRTHMYLLYSADLSSLSPS